MIKKLYTLTSSSHALMLAYRAEIYLWTIAHILPFIMMTIWATAASSSSSANFSLTPVGYKRYFLAVYIVRQLTAVWMIYEFEWHINEGRFSYLLLRPFHPIWQYVTAHLGEQLARLPFFTLIIAIFFILNPNALWLPAPLSIPLSLLAIYAAFSLRFVMQYCFALLTFWFERASSIDNLTFIPYLFLSGMIIPLSDFPPQAALYARLTPFPYMIDFPARIITGSLTLNSPELYRGLFIMLAWFLILLALSQLLWKRGLLKYSGHGA